MENAIQIFEHEQFGKVRVVMIDGEPWFVAADVCRILEIDKTQTRRLEDDEKGLYLIHTQGGEQSMLIVNEFGLYRLISTSRKPVAKKFQRWVYHEVLPSIRKTGSYSTAENLRYKFFHPTPEELERRSKLTTPEEITADLDAHGIEWDYDVTPTIETDENGEPRLVCKIKLVITDPEYENYTERLEAKKNADFLPG